LQKRAFLLLLLSLGLLGTTGCNKMTELSTNSPEIIVSPGGVIISPTPPTTNPVSQGAIVDSDSIPDKDPTETLNEILEELDALDQLMNGSDT